MIYLDNAATSFPKPSSVIRAMTDALQNFGANPGRGGHQLAIQAGRAVEKCREAAAELLGVSTPERVIFTRNCTESLNIAITTTHNLSQLEALNSGLLLTHSLLEAVFLAQEFIALFGELTALARYSLMVRNESFDLTTQ